MTAPDKNAIELRKFYTWIGADGIVRTVVKQDAEIFLQDAKENTAVVEKFYNGKKFPLLVDIRNIKSISPEAREHFTLKGRTSVVNAYSMVLSSPLSRMIGSFFLSFYKPTVPVKLFNDEKAAIAWLSDFINQN
jgi:hypothetical protein